jgi:acetyl esterase/lipase
MAAHPDRRPDPRSDDVLSRPAPPPQRTVSYGADAAQAYDVREPYAGSDVADVTVLVVHGGFWRAAYDRTHTGPQADALARAGFHVAVGEYRRAGMPGGGVPGTLDDVRDLVAAVRADAALPRRVVLIGHSAGGHLVAWAANQPWADDLLGVVALAGCVDLDEVDRRHLGADAARSFLGGGPQEVPEAWAAADPVRGLPPRTRVRILGGAQDDVVPADVADAYVDRAIASGGDVTARVLDDCGHYSLIDPEHPVFDEVLRVLSDLAG